MEVSTEELKQLGNTLFQNKCYIEAIEKYDEALARLSKGVNSVAIDSSQLDVISILWSNRSACNLYLLKYEDAVEDARAAIRYNPNSVKAYYRLAKGFLELGNTTECANVLESALVKDPKNKSLLSLKSELTSKYQRLNSRNSKNVFRKTTSTNCSFDCQCDTFTPVFMKDIQFCGSCGDNNIDMISYNEGDKLSPTKNKLLSILRSFIEDLIKGKIDTIKLSRDINVKGMFCKLCDPKILPEIVFPGTPVTVLATLPKNLKDLVLWKDLNLDIMKIATKAENVFNGVKKRGLDRGEVMDRDTEAAILPQIAYESLSLELVESVRILSRKMSAFRAQVSLKEASIDAPQAKLDQLDPESIDFLESKKFSIQREYMGEEWSAIILKDVQRYASKEKMTPKFSNTSEEEVLHPVTAFIDQDTLGDKYPALSELIQQLHSLPYEINEKTNSKYCLLEPVSGLTTLNQYFEGSCEALRYDNNAESTWDSAVRITCTFHLIPGTSSPGSLHLSSNYDEEIIPIEHDQLILHMSSEVQHKRMPAACEYFSIVFFLQARIQQIS